MQTINTPPVPREEKIEFNSKCCEAFGLTDIVREMMEKDLQRDLRAEAKKRKKKAIYNEPRK